MKFAKKREVLFIVLAFVLIVLFIVVRNLSNDGKQERRYAEIYEHDVLVHRLSLDDGEDHILDFYGEVRIHKYADGSIAFEESDCPDKVCIHAGKLRREGEMAACVPNGLLIKIVSEHANAESEYIADGNALTEPKENIQKEGKLSTSFTGYFDTICTLIGKDTDLEIFTAFATDFRKELEELHILFSAYEEGGKNLYYLNEHMNGGYDIEVFDKRFVDFIGYSIEAYYMTHGKVDISLGNAVQVWNTARTEKVPPSTEKIAELLAENREHALLNSIEINGNSITKKGGVVRYDAGAIAKGYALDLIAESLEERYPEVSVLVTMGGSMRAVGPHKEWSIGIQHPRDSGPFASFILPEGMSVSTSGDYERFFDYEGRRYHHIIDPDTMYPSEGVLSVTVVGSSGKLCDTLTTALFLLPPEEGIILAEELDASVLYILEDMEVVMSGDFPKIHSFP